MQKLNVVNIHELEAMTYEEICKYSDEIETNPNATEYDLVAVASEKLNKELKLGIQTGTPAEIFFAKLLKNNEKNSNIKRNSKRRFVTN